MQGSSQPGGSARRRKLILPLLSLRPDKTLLFFLYINAALWDQKKGGEEEEGEWRAPLLPADSVCVSSEPDLFPETHNREQ